MGRVFNAILMLGVLYFAYQNGRERGKEDAYRDLALARIMHEEGFYESDN